MASFLGNIFKNIAGVQNTDNSAVKSALKTEKNDIQSIRDSINQQQALNDQYTGNQGYNNSFDLGLQGAARLANEGIAQATQAARNAGMNKAQAAALGASTANKSLADAFNEQQNQVANQGSNAIAGQNAITSANQGVANTQSNLANQQSNEISAQQERSQKAKGSFLSSLGNIGKGIASIFTSDERCKDSDNIDEIPLSKLIENIDTYLFKYKEEAQNKYGVDDDTHIGVMAQELEENPITEESVKELDDGTKVVDTKELTMEQMAIISDLSKRLSAIEEKIGE